MPFASTWRVTAAVVVVAGGVVVDVVVIKLVWLGGFTNFAHRQLGYVVAQMVTQNRVGGKFSASGGEAARFSM
jgi:hypothetical protein